jgi:FkbM family methyltransferase
MHPSRRTRERLKRVVGRVGAEQTARAVYDALDSGRRWDRLDRRNTALLLAFTLARDSNCINVGAADGQLLRTMVRLAPEGRHMAFEPLPAFARRLAEEFPQVNVREAALSDRTGTSAFTHVPAEPGFSGLRRRSYPSPWQTEDFVVRTERLDDALPPDYVPHLIEVDVNGAELQVLRGAAQTLARHRPTVLFEHGAGAADHYGTRPGCVFRTLTEAGLRIFDMAGNGPYTARGFDEVFHRPIWNFVAHR